MSDEKDEKACEDKAKRGIEIEEARDLGACATEHLDAIESGDLEEIHDTRNAYVEALMQRGLLEAAFGPGAFGGDGKPN